MHKLMAIAVTIVMTSVYPGGSASANDKKPVDHAAVATAYEQGRAFAAHQEYIVIDRAGLIRFRQSGFSDVGSFQEIEGAIKKALKEKPETDTVATKTSAAGQPNQ